jgi:hypothetical protein
MRHAAVDGIVSRRRLPWGRGKRKDTMTEVEWLTRADPTSMLSYLQDKTSDRKLRLFACALCRSVWHLLQDERSRAAITTGERFADRLAPEHERRSARRAAVSARRSLAAWFYRRQRLHAEDEAPDGAPIAAADAAVCAVARMPFTPEVPEAGDRTLQFDLLLEVTTARLIEDPDRRAESERQAQAGLLRDIAGNPFRPSSLNATRLNPRNGLVRSMARQIYEEHSFADLPILADALEDAGCDNREILDHCRGPGEHARGCWVVDLLLGKA